MKTAEVERVGARVVALLAEYKGTKVLKNERAIDAVFLAYMRGAGYGVSRQHHVWMYGSSKPQRIDFRIAGNPRSVMELAVRPPSGRYQLSAEVNRDELLKLSRAKQQVAHMRYLVLLDLSVAHGPYSRAELKSE
jgi:hypothetical protein